jgi:hypothetical protein
MSVFTVSELMSRLAYGELSNLKMGDLNNGTIRAENVPAVLMQINKALKDIFTRFLLSSREIIIDSQAHITFYYLRTQFAQSNVDSEEEYLYLNDSAGEPFDGRVVKVLAVYDAYGRQLYMNKQQEPLSIFTPEYDCVQITAGHQTDQFVVVYQALHPVVTLDPDSIIYIPPSLENSLVLLTASKIYGNMSGPANASRSAILHQEYEASLMLAEIKDTASISENMSNSKLDNAGFI